VKDTWRTSNFFLPAGVEEVVEREGDSMRRIAHVITVRPLEVPSVRPEVTVEVSEPGVWGVVEDFFFFENNFDIRLLQLLLG